MHFDILNFHSKEILKNFDAYIVLQEMAPVKIFP